MKKTIKNNVHWVGCVDWELKKFHGEDFSTNHGSTYNSYLITEEKNVLIDTVYAPFSKDFTANLAKEIDLDSIDYIVINHGEVDHSGGLFDLMEQIPNTPIYCTENAVKSLKGQYHCDWDFHVVKTGDTLEIGNEKKLVFVQMPMLHWPDSMAAYLTKDNILFSNDAFGQHFANEGLYNDLADKCVLYIEAMKYFANILTPFSHILRKKLEEVISMDLPIDVIATSHGVIWRDDPMQIVKKYLEWADDYKENQITIIYDTMWGATKKLANKISEGIKSADPFVCVKSFNLSKCDQNDLITEIFKSKTVVMGSPTVLNGVLHSMAGFIYFAKSLKFNNKKAAAFGSYGWSGESVKVLNELLKEAGFELINEGLLTKWVPDDKTQAKAVEFGRSIAKG